MLIFGITIMIILDAFMGHPYNIGWLWNTTPNLEGTMEGD